MADLLDDLMDLRKQATTERSHYYVANCVDRSITEIMKLRMSLIAIRASTVVGSKPHIIADEALSHIRL